MSKNIIEKLIKLDNEECPEFTFSNPLLDRNVSRAVSKSVIKTLYKSDQFGKNQNVKKCMLQTIRNMCKSAPKGHMEIDDDLTEILTSFYEKQLIKSTASKNNIEKQLDAFLVRNSKASNLSTSYKSNINPEVLQALLNLKEEIVFSDNLSKDLVHWDLDDEKSRIALQNLWNEECSNPYFYDNVSIKMKSEIENGLLNISIRLLENGIDESLFLDCKLRSIVSGCAISAECFQICISIINTLFKKSNFNNTIGNFILMFIKNVKLKVKDTISVLYPCNLSNIVTILDFNLDELNISLKQSYVQLAKNYLKSLHENSEDYLIMLLSHFPTWFSIYFDE